MLLAFPALDYVSRWNSTNQRYFGTAKGAMGAASIIIGSFAMEQGKPYFASIANLSPGSNFYLSYAGQVPSAVTFSLHTGDNYISLPLNTTITNVTQLCDSMNLQNEINVVTIWNTTTQNYNSYTCGLESYNLSGGSVYRASVDPLISGDSWTQI
jgi:hypothetical protein